MDDSPAPDPAAGPTDLRRAAAYARRRAAWEVALDDPTSLLRAGVATRRFVRAVVDRSLHCSDDPHATRPLPHGAEVAELDNALGVIFGGPLRPGLFEAYLGELAFGEQHRAHLGEWVAEALLLRPARFDAYLADPTPHERLRREFGGRLAVAFAPDSICLAKQNLIEALDAAGLDAWAWGVRDGDFRRVCRRPAEPPDPDPEPEGRPAP